MLHILELNALLRFKEIEWKLIPVHIKGANASACIFAFHLNVKQSFTCRENTIVVTSCMCKPLLCCFPLFNCNSSCVAKYNTAIVIFNAAFTGFHYWKITGSSNGTFRPHKSEAKAYHLAFSQVWRGLRPLFIYLHYIVALSIGWK